MDLRVVELIGPDRRPRAGIAADKSGNVPAMLGPTHAQRALLGMGYDPQDDGAGRASPLWS